MTYVRLEALPATIRADVARRTISGTVVPWDTYALVSTGQRVAFAPDSLDLGDRVKLNLDHDPAQPVGVLASSSSGPHGLDATFRIPEGARGDAALADAASGLRDGFSLGADLTDSEDRDAGTYVTAARVRHVALLSEPAYDAARVTDVAATAPQTNGGPMATAPAITVPVVAAIQAGGPDPQPEPEPEPLEPDEITPTSAGRVAAAALPVAHVRDAFPYYLGGPHGMLRDAWLSREGDPEASARIVKAQRMNADPALVNQAMIAMAQAARVRAATGTTTGGGVGVVPPVYRPDWWTPLIAYEAPVYSACQKSPIADFSPFNIPKEVSRTGLSGTPADEVTPVAPGDITTAQVTVTPQQVYGAYAFSRALAMSSNPAIDLIALNAMDQEWLKDIETRAIAYFTAVANSTAASATYADGQTFVASTRGQMAAQRLARHVPTANIIAPAKEYLTAVTADDLQKRPLLGWDRYPNLYGPGEQATGAAEASVLGVPLHPEGAAPVGANKVLYIADGDAVCFTTPIMNFRFEASGTNPLVITVVKYSGVAFWTRYLAGVRLATNSTPLPLDDMDELLAADQPADQPADEADQAPAKARK